MEAPQQKNGMHWLLIVFVVIGVVVLLATVLDHPPGDRTEPGATLGGADQQEEPGPIPSDSEPGEVTKPTESAIQATPAAYMKLEPPKDRKYSSAKPLYFRVVFGEDGTDSTLGVVDESAGTGTGYDVAYVDENRNGDLTDDVPKRFPRYERGSRAGQTDPRFTFNGPLKDKASVKYSLNLYTLSSRYMLSGRASAAVGDHYFFWTMDTDAWHYFFINGKARLSPSVAGALTGPPVRLAGPCKWQISSKYESGKPVVSAALKDENGCTLRSVRNSRNVLSPRLSLTKDGKVALEENMKFG